jgi:steroid 5-alpha reductase family enzyme
MNLLIRITTALAVATVAAVAAAISYRHAYEIVSTHGEIGITARLLPFTIDGLILAASMLILDANRRNQRLWQLSTRTSRWSARWSCRCRRGPSGPRSAPAGRPQCRRR